VVKHNATGRSKGSGKYVQVHEYIMRCYAWKRLSPIARCAWLEINLIYNGSNNGRIGVSARQLAERLDVGKTAAANAIIDLMKWGFLDCVKASDFSRKKEASEYRLTHLPCDVAGEIASKRFLRIGKANVIPIARAAE
jgi:hypothetical protein